MRNQTCFLTSLASVAALLFVASTAHADDRAAARPLFDDGRRLMKEGKVAEACAKFEAASHLTSTAGVRLNLAGCWAKLGRTASAWGMYDEARAIADRSGDVAAAELAQKGKAELEPRLSRLVVNVEGTNVAGLQVTRDGESIYSGAWGVGVPVDPGEHEIAARAPGRKTWSAKTTVAGEGTSATVTVPVLEVEKSDAVATQEAATAQPAQRPEATPAGGAASSAGSTQRIIGLATGGVGIVALGVGAVFGLRATSEKNDYQGLMSNGHCINSTCATDSQSAASAGNLSTGFFVAGGVLVAAGAVVWLTAPKAHEAGVTAKIVPVFNGRTGSLSLEGSF